MEGVTGNGVPRCGNSMARPKASKRARCVRGAFSFIKTHVQWFYTKCITRRVEIIKMIRFTLIF